MSGEKIPVIRLNEKSLRRLKEKIGKLQDDKNVKGNFEVKKEVRAPKFSVYKPGVSRLSNRQPTSEIANSALSSLPNVNSRVPIETERTQHDETVREEKHSYGKRSIPKHGGSSNKPVVKTGYGRGRGLTHGRSTNVTKQAVIHKTDQERENSDESDYSDEEGFLARHNRRRKQQNPSYSSSQEFSDREESNKLDGSEDEFIWDDYHGHFLEDWEDNGQLSTSDEVVIPIEPKVKPIQQVNKNMEHPDINSPRQPEKDVTLSAGDGVAKSNRGLLIKKPIDAEQEPTKMTRKHLFNPNNPDNPIVVKPTQRSQKYSKDKTINLDPKNADKQEHQQLPVASSPNALRPLYPTGEGFYPNGRQDQARYTSYPSTIPPSYRSHPSQWGASSGINYHEEYDRNKSSPMKEQEDVIASSASDLPHHHSYEKLLNEAEVLESTITSLLSSSNFSLKNFNEKLQISRTKLKQIYKTLILNYIEISTKHNVEQMLWKNVYHQLMEQLRGRIASSSGEEKNDMKNVLIVVLDQATEFYENLLMRLQQTYKINLKELLANIMSSTSSHKRAGKRTKLAIMSCQRSLICLGDISRYKENANETSNFGRARHYYIQARSLEPRNGRPYNQLALLAVQTRRKLDAVYYYARSLATIGNPILTARESLIALFDDARRKIRHLKSKDQQPTQEQSKSSDPASDLKKRTSQPRVVWLLPGQTEMPKPTTDLNTKLPGFDQAKEQAPTPSNAMSPGEMLKHFILIFTHTHGKLFTRVGLDSFDSLKNELLGLFNTILGCDTTVISKQTLLHIFAINFFTVFDQHQRNKKESTSSQLSSRAVQLTFSMISILARYVTALLLQIPCNARQVYDPSYVRQLTVLLPSLKISLDWLYSNKNLWYPDPPHRPDDKTYDLWVSLAELCDWLIGDYKQFPMRIYTQNHHDLEEINLSEDFEFAGFSPLANVECEQRYVMISECTNTEQHTRAADCVRLDLIRDFLEYLCGMEQPPLAFKQGRYVVLVQSRTVSEDPSPKLSTGDDISPEMEDEQNELEEESIVEVKHDEDFNQLRALRDSLQQTKEVHDKRKDHIMASLEAKETDDAITVFVKPEHLIPDTNCFIDHLANIDSLLKTGFYTVFVPLVVLAELQGLAQDSKGRDDHAIEVHTNAVQAVEFLEDKFTSDRDTRLQALTNQGSMLHTITFQSQSDIGSKATNDDLILQCCIKHEEKNNPKYPKINSTVLLSDDRNLRVKALARNMPTKSIPEFCKWAGVGRT